MTVNNLDGHLRWMLVDKPCVPPPPPPVLPGLDHNEPLPGTAEARNLSTTSSLPAATLSGDSEAGDSALDVGPEAGSRSMARLRTAPTPISKPLLLSQHAQSPLGRQPGSTKHEHFRDGPAVQPKNLVTPRRSGREVSKHEDFSDVYSVDLTSSDRAPKVRPDAARQRSNRKRKSDEYEEDLSEAHESGHRHARTSIAPKASPPGEYTAIDDILDGIPLENPPPYSTGPMATVATTPEVSRARPNHPVTAILSNTVPLAKLTPAKRMSSAGTKSPVDPGTPTSRLCIRPSPTRGHWAETGTRGPGDRRMTPGIRKQVVTDSEDEGDETLWETRSTLSWTKGGKVVAAPLSPSPQKEKSMKEVKTVAKSSESVERIGRQIQSASASDFGPAFTAVDSEETALSIFMQWPGTALEDYQTRLLSERRAKARSAANAVRHQENAQLQQLQAELRLLNPRISACEELQRHRGELAKTRRRCTELEDRVVEAIEHDPDLTGANYTAINEEYQAVLNAVRHLERETVKLLRLSGLLTSEQGPLQLAVPAERQNVAVQSTQSGSSAANQSRALPANNPNALSTQRVQQTQEPAIGALVSESPCKPRAEHGSGPPFAAKQPALDSSRRNRLALPKYPASPAKPKYHHEPDEDEFEELRAAEETLFETNMGGYVDTYDASDHDEYDMDILDDEMLGLADLPENHGAVGGRPSRPGPRKVLGSAAGNEMPPPALSASKRGKQALRMSVPDSASHLMQFNWSADVKQALLHRFKLRGFRSNQLEAINATLAGKDAFVLMPTGGGKSLCYQLPSIVKSGKTRGVTLVISPLLSLMEDQVSHLQKIFVQAYRINSECTADEKSFIYQALRDPKVEDLVQLLYVAPEMINTNQTFLNALHRLHERGCLARIVIDEAHCVSQWGHDFRPDYKALGEIRKQFHGIPVMALTATATENVKADVIHNLGMRGCEVFSQSFNRPNLNYEVRPKGGGNAVLDEIASIITTKHQGQSGIIYCLSRKTCEQVAQALSEQYHVKAHHYHAQVATAEKRRIQQMWQKGKYSVIVATIAFGMGIDKPDVRYVIHHTIPKSLEGYYQETGRAGRDGLKSSCYLFYGFKDTTVLRKMIQDGDGDAEQKKRQHAMLRHVVQFCENKADCRRVQVLAYFNEAFRQEDCNGGCDNCNSNTVYESCDYTSYAKLALSLVERLQSEDVTLHQCVDVFRGGGRLKQASWRSLPEYGSGSDLDRGDADRIFFRLTSEEALTEVNRTNRAGFTTAYLRLGKNHRAFQSGKKKLHIQVRVTPNPKRTKTTTTKARAGPSRLDNPASTNVSSPIQAASRRRRAAPAPNSDNEDSFAFETMHANGYQNDGFVVSDDNNDDDDDDDMDDHFEPVRVAGKKQPTRRYSPGPPITIDEKLASLSETHQGVVEGFVSEARELNRKIMMDKGLRAGPFSDTILRVMAIDFPRNQGELLKVPGINEEMVREYGKRFLKLIDQTRRFYEDAMQTREDRRDHDPNHQVVVDLTEDGPKDAAAAADEEDGTDSYGSDFEENEAWTDSPAGERSSYFSSADHGGPSSFGVPSHVAASQARWKELTEAGERARAEREASTANVQSDRRSRGGRFGSRRGRGGASRGPRKSGGGASAKRSGSATYARGGVTKSRASGGARRAPNVASQGGGRSASGGRGRGGFGMMPC